MFSCMFMLNVSLQGAKNNMLYMRIPFSLATKELRCLCCCVSWSVGSLPWHWMTTGKCCQDSSQSNHHSCDSHRGRSCQMERKGLFFDSSVFPILSLTPSFAFVFFVGWASLSFFLFQYLSLFVQKKASTSSPSLTLPVFLHLSNHHYIMSLGF